MAQNTETRNCKCGSCGQQVTGKAIYRPGHDAKHVSFLLTLVWESPEFRNGSTGDVEGPVKMTKAAIGHLPTPALQTKFTNALSRKIDKEWDRYSAKVNTNADAGCHFGWHPDEFWHAMETPTAQARPIQADGGEIKVGRWTYPTGSRPGQDTIYRNTKRDGSGDWTEVN